MSATYIHQTTKHTGHRNRQHTRRSYRSHRRQRRPGRHRARRARGGERIGSSSSCAQSVRADRLGGHGRDGRAHRGRLRAGQGQGRRAQHARRERGHRERARANGRGPWERGSRKGARGGGGGEGPQISDNGEAGEATEVGCSMHGARIQRTCGNMDRRKRRRRREPRDRPCVCRTQVRTGKGWQRVSWRICHRRGARLDRRVQPHCALRLPHPHGWTPSQRRRNTEPAHRRRAPELVDWN